MHILPINNLKFEAKKIKYHTGKLHEGLSLASQKTKKLPSQYNFKTKTIKNQYERDILQIYNNKDNINESVENLEQQYYQSIMELDNNKIMRKRFKI